MKEVEWLESQDPIALLNHLYYLPDKRPHSSSKWRLREGPLLSYRKARLFLVGCCRLVWDLIGDEKSQKAVEIAEKYADCPTPGPALEHKLEQAHNYIYNDAPHSKVWIWCYSAICFNPEYREVFAYSRGERDQHPRNPPLATQAHLLRCVAGNPFRPSNAPPLEKGIAQTIAWSIYQDRSFEQLPILADALEEEAEFCETCYGQGHRWYCKACRSLWRFSGEDPTCVTCPGRPCEKRTCEGCEGSGLCYHFVIKHLREPGPHARGCWALDRLLGKE